MSEGFKLERAVIGAGRDELHADEEAVAVAEEAIDRAGCMVSVGSGTITDLCKIASKNRGYLPFVVVQSARSVNGFSDDFTVLLKGGAKCTVPSRYSDALLVDLLVLSKAPHEMNVAGFGDLLASFTALADWYLAYRMGMGDYHQTPITLLLEQAHELPRRRESAYAPVVDGDTFDANPREVEGGREGLTSTTRSQKSC